MNSLTWPWWALIITLALIVLAVIALLVHDWFLGKKRAKRIDDVTLLPGATISCVEAIGAVAELSKAFVVMGNSIADLAIVTLGEFQDSYTRAENFRVKRELSRACHWGRALGR